MTVGFYDCSCMITGVGLLLQRAVLVLLEEHDSQHRPCALGIRGTYNRLGSIDAISENENTSIVMSYFAAKHTNADFEIFEDYSTTGYRHPLANIEQLLDFLTKLDAERKTSQYAHGFPNGDGDCNCITWLERMALPMLRNR